MKPPLFCSSLRSSLVAAADVKAVTPEGLTCYRMAVKRNYHTLARLVKEYDRLKDGGAANYDDDRSAYTSNSDAEGVLSGREGGGSLPRPHKGGASPSIASMKNGKGSGGRNLLASKTSGR